MFKIFSFLLIVLVVSLQISAQCGVYFQESHRQVFSNSFVNGYFDDFDGDGLDDLFGYSVSELVTGTPRSFQIRYYRRLSQSSFDTNAKSTLITNVGAYFGVTGDVNGDGKKDLIVPHRTTPRTVTAYLNDGTGGFAAAAHSAEIDAAEVVLAAGDLNNDGRADIVTDSAGELRYRLAQPDSSFGAGVSIGNIAGNTQHAPYMDWFSSTALIEDLNNDGSKDIALTPGPGAQAKLQIYTNNGSLIFAQTYLGDFYSPNTKLRTYDLNNDGKRDFVTNASGGGAQVRIAVNNGDNTFTTSTYFLPPTQRYDSQFTKDFLVADFDNDGDADLLYPGSKGYVVLRNQGNAAFVQQAYKPFLNVASVASLDGDGKADAVALVNPLLDGQYRLNDGNNNYYYLLHNAVSFGKNVCQPRGQTKIVDFDGDAVTDRAFWTPSNGVWRYYTQLVLGNTEQATFQWGAAGDLPVPNDYDGDGLTDYAVFRRSSGTWLIRRSSDQQFFAMGFGINEDKPVPADYDGDGRADIAVYRPSTGDWHLWLSGTNQYAVTHFGISEDKPVPADYDGDGKADITVFRPSTGVWYRLNSSDNSVFIVQYGISTDKPMPGDYDGDGKANVAVFRSGAWYVLKNDFSSSVFNFGIAGDEPFFDDSPVVPGIGAFRRSESRVWIANSVPVAFAIPWFSNNSASDVFVSSILPPE